MHRRFAAAIEEGLTSLGRRLENSRSLIERGPVERQIGRLLQRNSRAAGRYTITVADDAACASRLRLQWSVRPEWDDWAALSEGCYVLRTNVNDWTAETLWQTYIQLTEPRRLFGSTRASCPFVRCGITGRSACRRTSSCAFLATCCGRPWSSGKSGQVWATARAPFSTNSRASTVPTSSCPPQTGASLDPLRSPTGPGSSPAAGPPRPETSRTPPHALHELQNVVPTRRPNYAKSLNLDPELRKLG